MPIPVVVTAAGRAAIVNAENTGTLPVVITQAGVTATAVTPTEAATVLPGEIKRLSSIAGEVVSADTIHVTAMDTSNDAYDLRGAALYLGDGTLFAVAGQADPILSKAAPSIAQLAFDLVLTDIAATSVTFGDASFSNPPATTERQGVVELATVPEAQVGIDALRALTPASARAAILGWLLAQDGSGSGLDADMLDGQHASAFQPALGFTPVNRAGDTMTGQLTLVGDPVAGGHAVRKAYLDAVISTLGELPGSLLAKLITVDGSGSGLDADLLDGQHASAFQPALSLTSNAAGYCVSIGIGVAAIKVQWGRAYSGSDGFSGSQNFPVAFNDPASVAIVANKTVSQAGSADGNDISSRVISGAQFQIGSDEYGGALLCSWIAIGI